MGSASYNFKLEKTPGGPYKDCIQRNEEYIKYERE